MPANPPPQQQPDYVNPYSGMGGQINSMKRFDEMQRLGAAGMPAPPPSMPSPPPAPPQQNSMIQGLLAAIKSYMPGGSPTAPMGPPAQAAPPQSFDTLLQGMKDVNARARNVMR